MDFTVKTYRQLLQAIKASEYAVQNMASFMEKPADRVIVLRHDVDARPVNALQMAEAEHQAGIYSTFYFRIGKISNNPEIIRAIAEMGHEIGYHYEDFAACQGDPHKAAGRFKRNLAYFRQFYPVKTVCMHGSPLSRHDNRDMWQTSDYREFGIIGEPYFDVDFTKVFYLTDTGRKWNHAGASIRDRVDSGFDIPVNSSAHLTDLVGQGELPDKVMITVHPQRWHDKPIPWMKELVWQNVKNVVKKVFKRLNFMRLCGKEDRRGGL